MEKLGTKQNKIVAITGGIGSGKSTVLSIVKEMGYKTLSCDEFTVKAYKNHKVRAFIKCNYADCCYGLFKNKIDKKILAKSVFSNKTKREMFNAIISPIIFNMAYSKAKRERGLCFLEVPLLFEGGYNKNFSYIWVINRDLEKRKESVKFRSNMTEEEFIKRVKSQYDYKDVFNATIIQNDGNIDKLKESIKEKIKEIE